MSTPPQILTGQNRSPKKNLKHAMAANIYSTFNKNHNINTIILRDSNDLLKEKHIYFPQQDDINNTNSNNTNTNNTNTETNNTNTNNTNVPITPKIKKFNSSLYCSANKTMSNILTYYIDKLNDEWGKKYQKLQEKYIKEKREWDIKLSYLIKENKSLKLKILNILDTVKKHEDNNIIYNKKAVNTLTQLIKENQFLRNMNNIHTYTSHNNSKIYNIKDYSSSINQSSDIDDKFQSALKDDSSMSNEIIKQMGNKHRKVRSIICTDKKKDINKLVIENSLEGNNINLNNGKSNLYSNKSKLFKLSQIIKGSISDDNENNSGSSTERQNTVEHVDGSSTICFSK